MATVTPRALRADEQQTLDFLLGSPLPGIDELRGQVPGLRVVGDCDCGCATIDLLPDKDHVPRAVTQFSRVAVTAFSRDSAAAHPAELLLHVIDGWLAELEIVDYRGDNPQDRFPDLDTWQAPGDHALIDIAPE